MSRSFKSCDGAVPGSGDLERAVHKDKGFGLCGGRQGKRGKEGGGKPTGHSVGPF
jgi:hypothetical protein